MPAIFLQSIPVCAFRKSAGIFLWRRYSRETEDIACLGQDTASLPPQWARQGSNLGPTDYESAALTN